MKYALLDWDNTLRKGYSLFSWCNFLVEKAIIDKASLDSINLIKQKYENRLISHDDFAKISCEIFGDYLQGISLKKIASLEKEFIDVFKKDLFSFSKGILNYLENNNYKIIIVSGAPKSLIEQCIADNNNVTVFGLEFETNNNKYTGLVKRNYGFNKNEIVDFLIAKYGKPSIAFGDSSSDIYMLNEAEKSVLVVLDQMKIALYKADMLIYESDSSNEACEKIEFLLKNEGK